jgi:hypothetical protein
MAEGATSTQVGVGVIEYTGQSSWEWKSANFYVFVY